MIAESARIPMMGRDFVNIYYGCDVVADEAIRSYDDAKNMMRLASEKFSEYPNHLAIEKLAKRADEMSTLLKRVGAAVNTKDRVDLLPTLVRGRLPTIDASVKDEAQRFRDMCTQLKFTEPQDVQRFLSAFSKVRFAQRSRVSHAQTSRRRYAVQPEIESQRCHCASYLCIDQVLRPYTRHQYLESLEARIKPGHFTRRVNDRIKRKGKRFGLVRPSSY